MADEFGNLMQGLQMFNQGLTSLAVSRASNDANRALSELNGMELDDNQRLQEQNKIANDLRLKLTAGGADAAKIDAATQGIGVGAGAQFQAMKSQELQASSQKFQGGENDKERQARVDLASQQAKINEQKAQQDLIRDKKLLGQKTRSEIQVERVKQEGTQAVANIGAQAKLDAENAKRAATLGERQAFGMQAKPGIVPSIEDAKIVKSANAELMQANVLQMELKEIVETHSAAELETPAGSAAKARVGAIVAELRGVYKGPGILNLGASLTNNEDEKMLGPIIADPRIIWQKRDTVLAGLDQLGSSIASRVVTRSSAHGYDITPGGDLEGMMVRGKAPTEAVGSISRISQKLKGKKLDPNTQAFARYLKSQKIYQDLNDPNKKEAIMKWLKDMEGSIK